MLHAYRGIGKTHLALAIGYCAASGGKLFDTWSAPLPRRVLYLDGEMPAGAMQERLAAIVDGFEAQPPDPSYFMLLSADQIEDGLPDLGTDEGRSEIDGAILRTDAEFVIVDNCSTLIRTGKENEGDSWLSVQSWALAHRRSGRSILFVHHDGKGGQQRGTSRRVDVLDTVIALRRPEDYRAEQGARFEVVSRKRAGSMATKPRARAQGKAARLPRSASVVPAQGQWHRAGAASFPALFHVRILPFGHWVRETSADANTVRICRVSTCVP